MASQTGVSADRVLISSISGGSAVVAFSVTPAADGTPLAANTLTAAFAGAVSLPSVGASTTAAVSTPTVSDAAPTAAEMATLQAHVAALPSGADITALQTQVTQLMGAHFICANGYGGADCTRDLTPPELTCPPGTISVSLAVGAAVTSAMIPRPSTLSDTGPGPASVLTVLLTPNDGDVFSSSSTPDGAAQWASPDHPFTFSASTAVGPD